MLTPQFFILYVTNCNKILFYSKVFNNNAVNLTGKLYYINSNIT